MALKVTGIITSGEHPVHISELLVQFDVNKSTWYKREDMFAMVQRGDYVVNINPFPLLVASVSSTGTKYVHSKGDGTTNDNLMKLPRYTRR